MSNLKYDAMVRSGIEVVERVPIPADQHPRGRPGRDGRQEGRRLLRRGGADRGRARRDQGARARGLWRRLSVGSQPGDAIAWLRTPQAIRARAGLVLAAAERGELEHFALDAGRLDPAADYVIETIRAQLSRSQDPLSQPLAPFRGRRPRPLGGAGGRAGRSIRTRWRALRFDLVVTSVLLDAGAGDAWRYAEPGDAATVLTRSEGLAVASLDLFRSGALSADPAQPLRADAEALIGLDERTLGDAFQVSATNPLVGARRPLPAAQPAGRGAARASPRSSAPSAPRIGGLFDHLAGQAEDGRLPAPAILAAVLEGLGEIWPGRIALAGVNLGDVGRHPAAASDDLTSELVPFHKLSQWLAYSLIEPLEDAGISGHRPRPADRARRVPQRRPADRPRRAAAQARRGAGRGARRQLRDRGRMARADRRADRPPGGAHPGEARPDAGGAAARQGAGGRHLGRRPADRPRAASGRRPAAAAA